MTRFLTVLAAGSAVALASIAAPTAADARCRGCGIAAGVIGGIVDLSRLQAPSRTSLCKQGK